MTNLRSRLIAEIPTAGSGWGFSKTEQKAMEFLVTVLAACATEIADRIEAARRAGQSSTLGTELRAELDAIERETRGDQ